ncbi:MAG TPA: DciA family protein, partial [Rhodanobacter sp.]|nr:DciA family protein [Rhodanobacter sp.]
MQRAAPATSRRTGNGPKPLVEFGSFATLARKAGALEALDRALRQTLPSPLREQVRFANLRNERLVFLASSPAWASRLRLMQT